jgi:hypothetical protein
MRARAGRRVGAVAEKMNRAKAEREEQENLRRIERILDVRPLPSPQIYTNGSAPTHSPTHPHTRHPPTPTHPHPSTHPPAPHTRARTHTQQGNLRRRGRARSLALPAAGRRASTASPSSSAAFSRFRPRSRRRAGPASRLPAADRRASTASRALSRPAAFDRGAAAAPQRVAGRAVDE